MRRRPYRQRGVAVITALLLTTLAVTIVASLFWQQQVQVRSIENQRLQLQKQWILRGALDWSRIILRQTRIDRGAGSDNLQQPWAVGLAETRLDSYVENGRSDSEASDATITGKIIDAQSRLNLRGLARNGIPDPAEVKVFQKLLTVLKLDPALAQATAIGVAAGQPRLVLPTGGNSAQSGAGAQAGVVAATDTTAQNGSTAQSGSAVQNGGVQAATAGATQVLAISQVDDLLAIPGYTPATVAKLRDFVIFLPQPTAVNVNTAPAEVLAARIDTLSDAGAQAIVAQRDRIPWRDIVSFKAQALNGTVDPQGIDVKTDYFIVDGKVRLSRAALEVEAVVGLDAQANATIVSVREK